MTTPPTADANPLADEDHGGNRDRLTTACLVSGCIALTIGGGTELFDRPAHIYAGYPLWQPLMVFLVGLSSLTYMIRRTYRRYKNRKAQRRTADIHQRRIYLPSDHTWYVPIEGDLDWWRSESPCADDCAHPMHAYGHPNNARHLIEASIIEEYILNDGYADDVESDR